jgi:hypothetical protein
MILITRNVQYMVHNILILIRHLILSQIYKLHKQPNPLTSSPLEFPIDKRLTPMSPQSGLF